MSGSPAKVLQVITRLNVGGPARHVLELDAKLPSLGFDSSIVWGREGKHEGRIPLPPETDDVHISDLRRRLHPWRDVRSYRALRRAFARLGPDVVHTHLAKAGTLGRAAARAAGVRVVVHTYHGHVLTGYFSRPVARLFTTVERAAARHTDALVAVSPQVRDELYGLGIGRDEQWHVMPLGLGITYLLRSRMSRAEGRARLDLPPDGPLVGIVARLTPIKDVGCFLEAAARVAAVRQDATFVVAGNGQSRRELEKNGRALLGGRVRFLGWVRDLEALYSALDVVVLTSRSEGTPVALIEAGATGRPVVATNVGGVAEVIRDGVTGTLVPQRSAQAVADGILHFLDHPDTAKAFGEAGRRIVGERFGGPGPVSYVTGLYQRLLERR